MSEINTEQLQDIGEIASRFENLKCVECALAIENYLTNQNIRGTHIKLDTGAIDDDRNNFIYDDSVANEAIAENGRHEGIAIVINGVEMVFDNHHPNGLPRNEWMTNLQFFGKINVGQEFQVTEENF